MATSTYTGSQGFNILRVQVCNYSSAYCRPERSRIIFISYIILNGTYTYYLCAYVYNIAYTRGNICLFFLLIHIIICIYFKTKLHRRVRGLEVWEWRRRRHLSYIILYYTMLVGTYIIRIAYSIIAVHAILNNIQRDLLSLWLSMIEILMFLFKSVRTWPRVYARRFRYMLL